MDYTIALPSLNHRRLEGYEICKLYGVTNMTTAYDGVWIDQRLREVVGHYYSCSTSRFRGSTTIALKDPDNVLRQAVAAIAEDERYKPWIKREAEKMVNKYEVEVLNRKPRYITEL